MRTHVIITINVLAFSIFWMLFAAKMAGYQLGWLDVSTPLLLLALGHLMYQVVKFLWAGFDGEVKY